MEFEIFLFVFIIIDQCVVCSAAINRDPASAPSALLCVPGTALPGSLGDQIRSWLACLLGRISEARIRGSWAPSEMQHCSWQLVMAISWLPFLPALVAPQSRQPRDATSGAVATQSPCLPVGSIPYLPFWPYHVDLVSLFEIPVSDSVSSGSRVQ